MKDKKALKIGIAILGAVIIIVVAVLFGGKMFKKDVPTKDNGTITDADKDDTTEEIAKVDEDTEDPDDRKDVSTERKEDSTEKDNIGSGRKEGSTEKGKDTGNKKEEGTTEARKGGSNKAESTTEAPKNKGNDSGNKGGNNGGNKQDTTEAPKDNTTESPKDNTEAKKEDNTEAPKQEACSHSWVWHTHTEKVHHSEQYKILDAWDEPIEVQDVQCNCGAVFATENDLIIAGHAEHGGYGSHTSVTGYIHHDATYGTDEWDTYEDVKDYEYCSKCGAKK